MSQHVSIAVALVLVIVLTGSRGSSQCTLNQLQIPSDERLAINDTLTHTFVSAIEVSRPVLVELAATLVSPNEINNTSHLLGSDFHGASRSQEWPLPFKLCLFPKAHSTALIVTINDTIFDPLVPSTCCPWGTTKNMKQSRQREQTVRR